MKILTLLILFLFCNQSYSQNYESVSDGAATAVVSTDPATGLYNSCGFEILILHLSGTSLTNVSGFGFNGSIFILKVNNDQGIVVSKGAFLQLSDGKMENHTKIPLTSWWFKAAGHPSTTRLGNLTPADNFPYMMQTMRYFDPATRVIASIVNGKEITLYMETLKGGSNSITTSLRLAPAEKKRFQTCLDEMSK